MERLEEYVDEESPFNERRDFEISHIKGKENKVVDALSRNTRLKFVVATSTYKIDLEDQMEGGVKLDENYQKLQANVAKNLTEISSTGYILNEKGFLVYKDRLYIPNVPKVKLLILNEIHKNPYSGHVGYQKSITML